MAKRQAHVFVLTCLLAWTSQAVIAVAQAQTTPPAETPPDIISDEAFDAALPDFDTTVDAAPDDVPTATLPPAETADATVVITESPPSDADALPAVTIDDSELDTPLPVLEGYDVQPLQASAEVARDLPEIRYSLDIDGLSQAGLGNRFKALSALEAADGKAVNTAMIRARANEDEALALRLLTSEGYFDGSVTTTLAPSPQNPADVHVQMTAQPGPRYSLKDIQVDAGQTVPPDLVRNALPLKPADPIVADAILAAEAQVSVEMQQNGYPFATIGTRDILLDDLAHTGDYRLSVDTGARSRFGGFRSDGEIVFQPDHIAILTRFERGDLYDNRKVDDLREALVATGLFRSVGVEPVATPETAPDGATYVDLLVRQQKGPSRTLAADIGFSTGEGVTASATWTDRNRFPPEGAVIYSGAVGTQEQSLSATFRRANDKQRDRTTQMAISAAHAVYDAYDANTFSLSASRSRVSTPLWQKLWTWSYGLEVLATQEISTDLLKNTGTIREVFYLADVPIRVGYDRSDDLLNPTRGFRLGVQTVPELSLGDSGAPNIKTLFDASYYRTVRTDMVLATRLRLGTQLGATIDQIAPSRRLYAGGGGSVRGFAYQGLGPLDVDGDPTGGLSVFEASLELRYRLGDLGLVPFIDIGQAYGEEVPGFSDLRMGLGVGARLYTNFGPIRIDIATPLGRREDEPIVALYVGIGQAF